MGYTPLRPEEFASDGYNTDSADWDNLFEINREHDCLVVELLADVGEVDEWRVRSELEKVLELLDWTGCSQVVFDFEAVSWSVPAAVAMYVLLAKQPEIRSHRIRVRGLSEHQRSALRQMGVESLWPEDSAVLDRSLSDSGSFRRPVGCP